MFARTAVTVLVLTALCAVSAQPQPPPTPCPPQDGGYHPYVTLSLYGAYAAGFSFIGAYGFQPNETLLLRVRDIHNHRIVWSAQAMANSDGQTSLTTKINIPASTEHGIYPVCASGLQSGLEACTLMLVWHPTLHISSHTVQPGGNFVVTIRDFAPFQVARLYFDNIAYIGELPYLYPTGETSATQGGVATWHVTLPARYHDGDTVHVSVLTFRQSFTATIQVRA